MALVTLPITPKMREAIRAAKVLLSDPAKWYQHGSVAYDKNDKEIGIWCDEAVKW